MNAQAITTIDKLNPLYIPSETGKPTLMIVSVESIQKLIDYTEQLQKTIEHNEREYKKNVLSEKEWETITTALDSQTFEPNTHLKQAFQTHKELIMRD